MSFIDAPEFTPAQGNQQPDNVRPRFYVKPVQNGRKTTEEGRPVFDDQEYVEIHVPGDKNSIIDTPVRDEHKRRWPQHYAHFKGQQEAPSEGWALTEWPGVTRSQAEELAYFKVKTVEDVAGLSDTQLSKCLPMGGFPLREAAKRALELAKGAAPAEKLAAENAAKDAKIGALEDTVKDLARRLDEMTAQRNAGT